MAPQTQDPQNLCSPLITTLSGRLSGLLSGLRFSNHNLAFLRIPYAAPLFGSVSNPIYLGSNLAAQVLAVVTVNYRLGRFGFLVHAKLNAELGCHGSGNYGIMDQIAALGWVQRNIVAFGGDAGNVTLGAVPAGGASDGGGERSGVASAERAGEELLRSFGASSVDDEL
ncbi:hypothetical protein VTI74DRAFT_3930 [Chaetomium olivicolor]